MELLSRSNRDAPALLVTPACTARRTSMNAPDLKGELPCRNGGKCFNAVNNFTCDCQNTGYTGDNSIEDIDECVNSQTDCGHDGCQNLPGSYECVCDFGFCGYNCAMLDPCQENGGQRSAGVPKMADTNVNALLNTRD
nr:PREDICTED: protein crumbs-like [Linepithema humile]